MVVLMMMPLYQQIYIWGAMVVRVSCGIVLWTPWYRSFLRLRQISAKDPDSHSWFVSCNELLHKYSLPNIYTVRAEFGSEPQVKQHVKTSVVRYIDETWLSVVEDRKSLGFLNMESYNVGNIHPCWSTVDNSHRCQESSCKGSHINGYIPPPGWQG